MSVYLQILGKSVPIDVYKVLYEFLIPYDPNNLQHDALHLAGSRRLKGLNWLYKHHRDHIDPEQLWKGVLFSEDPRVFEWAMHRYGEHMFPGAWKGAFFMGLNKVREIYALIPQTVTPDLLNIAVECACGIEVMEWFESLGIRGDHNTVIAAAEHNNFWCLEWMLVRRPEVYVYAPEAMREAGRSESYGTLCYLLKTIPREDWYNFTGDDMDFILREHMVLGRTWVFEKLWKMGWTCSPGGIEWLVQNNHMSTLRRLLELNRDERPYVHLEVFDIILATRNLPLLIWMSKNWTPQDPEMHWFNLKWLYYEEEAWSLHWWLQFQEALGRL